MTRSIVFAFSVFCSLPNILMAQSESASRVALLQRFVAPKPMSYRAEVMFGPGNLESIPNGVSTIPTRILEVRNGLLISSPAVPGTQFAISDQAKSISALLSNYQAQWQEIATSAKLADRSIQQLTLIPKDGWRYTRVLWLDEQTGVPLKTEIFRKNELIERIQVKTIDFLDLGTGDDTRANGQSGTESTPEISTQSIFYVRNLPSGFVLTSVFNDTTHVQQIYSDGLARVSVFVQSLGALPAAGYSQRGSTAFVVRRNGNVDLVAVGDVPQATLDRFLSGVDAIQQ